MKSKIVYFASFLILVGVLVASFYLSATSQETPPPPASTTKGKANPFSMAALNAQLFDAILDRIKSDYVEKVSDEKLLEGALNGMLSSLDPHSAYLSPKAYEELKSDTKGEFGGLGLEVIMDKGVIKIISPIDDTPAEKAGLQTGDLIVAIDKKPIVGMTLLEAVELMRGKPGTKVRLLIKREGKDAFEVTLTRALIRPKLVKYHTEGNVGYIRIATFADEKTDVLLKEAVLALQKELGSKLEGIILDVRNNPGGLLDVGVNAANMFLTKGQEIVSIKGRHPKMDTAFFADGQDILKGLPIVLLINGGSASCSEILAGALQDNHRAIVAGTKSFGKGSVQVILPLTNKGALKLTIARYYTPSGISIQAKGIEPNIVIDQIYGDLKAVNENDRIHEEDFRGALDKENAKKEDLAKTEDAEHEHKKESIEKDKTEKAAHIKDYQLMRAVDIVRTMYLTQRFGKKEPSCR